MRYPPIKDTSTDINDKGEKICRNCDNLVSPSRRHYCSEECMKEFMRNNTWSIVRQDVLQRDGYCCRICNKRCKKSLLDVDHIIPVRMGGALFDKDNLRTLCKECHKAKTKLDSDALNRKPL